MNDVNEKKPPAGGVVDVALVKRRHAVVGALLNARAELARAQWVAGGGALVACSDAIGQFVATEFDALLARAMVLVAEEPANQNWRAR